MELLYYYVGKYLCYFLKARERGPDIVFVGVILTLIRLKKDPKFQKFLNMKEKTIVLIE